MFSRWRARYQTRTPSAQASYACILNSNQPPPPRLSTPQVKPWRMTRAKREHHTCVVRRCVQWRGEGACADEGSQSRERNLRVSRVRVRGKWSSGSQTCMLSRVGTSPSVGRMALRKSTQHDVTCRVREFVHHGMCVCGVTTCAPMNVRWNSHEATRLRYR
jgi:hypothetical protein